MNPRLPNQIIGIGCAVCVFALCFVSCAAPGAETKEAGGVVKLSSTIGPIDAGIVPLLAQTYEERTGTKIEFEGAGTGATLEKAKSGNFDMVIVHARSLEDKFIADGFGVDRRDIMYNDFVILGPANDPAGIKGMKDAAAAFAKIASAKTLFVTRGDMSGTHVKELEVWDKTGTRPDSAKDKWYATFAEGSKGNAHTTLYANSVNAYLLMDRATYLIQKSNIKLVPLVENDSILLNYIASIQVNPAQFPNVNAKGAKAFIDWLCGDEAQTIIKNFEVQKYGEPLFFPNSDEWNKKNAP
jgi:tungstate transport system substrate-binding protein